MAKKKQAKMTSRQRQSQRIMREKAARKKRRRLIHRAQIIGIAVLALTVVGGGSWLWLSGAAAQIATDTVNGAYRLTARAGFDIQSVYLEGRDRTALTDINRALALTKGQSIFRADLDVLREELEKIDSVQMAAIERALPHTLYVRIVEREPVALWQNEGKLLLVDEKGVVMSGIDSAPYAHLPLIIGEGAPQHASELLTILATQPQLLGRFAAAIYTGERRWNVRFINGLEVKLPEEGAMKAWETLASLQEKQQLLDRAVKVVDLRLQGRLFITVAPQDMPKTRGAKDT